MLKLHSPLDSKKEASETCVSAKAPAYSVVIPVFNSEKTLPEVVREVQAFFDSRGLSFEIVLVNDGSRDRSWEVAKKLCAGNERFTAVDLLKNYGQHAANLCGFREARGEYVITMDDDLQNPAGEIAKLIDKAGEGHDLVIGRYKVKCHSLPRRLGSRLVAWLNEKIFAKPRDLTMSNFRLAHRAVIERLKSYQGIDPYVPGLLIAYSHNPANADVEHRPRAEGRSQYGFLKIARLVFSLLFNHSIYPLRFLILTGGLVSLFSFCMGAFFFMRGFLQNVRTSGWASIMTLISFFSGFIILILGVLGEYVIRITRTVNAPSAYHVREVLRHEA